MSCQDSSSSNSGYSYSHHETATAHLYPSSSAIGNNNNNLKARISLESTSTLHSSTPIFHQSSINNNIDSWDIKSSVLTNGTPFSRQVLDLLSQYHLQRLLIRIGDAATTSSSGKQYNDEQQLQQEERSSGPSGTSIYATFATDSNNNNNHEDVKVQYQNQYASLLRYLLDNTLFPPCGAPLDSIRVRKHGHSTIVHSSITQEQQQQEGDETNIQSVNVESFLAADAATFCNPGTKTFLLSGGWGSATNNGACHSTNDKSWGLFDALFPSSQSSALSDILLGSSLDAAPWESTSSSLGSNKRHSVWIDMQVSPSCFVSSSNGEEECSINVTRGTSYRVAMPHSANQNQRNAINLSLGDILLGHDTLKQSLSTVENGSRKEWHPCPLSDSSRILLYLPNGCGANFANEDFTVDAQIKGKMEFNVLTSNNGYIDLTTPWVQLSYNNDKISTPQSSLYGISRTVQRPLGIASSGTLISVVRYSQSDAISTDSKLVKVKSLDVLPGTLVKSRMHTLRMVLYQGDGAGGERFVPPSHSYEYCECNETNSFNNDDKASSDQCGLVCSKQISLPELQDHKITLHSDGTILLERTTLFQPDSSLWMMVDFDEAYLPFQKFPADANRGVDTYPSRATFTPLSADETKSSLPISPSTTLYSSSLLILPPVPDMSMPFNVISLSCTLWAFVLGSLLNILVRRGTESVKRELTGEEEKRPIHKIRDKLKEKAGKLKDKLNRLKSKIGRSSAVNSKVDANDEKEKTV